MTNQLDPLSSKALAFTGERFVPEVHGNIELEHLHRYLQACEIATDKVVLDIACGEGYGSNMLAVHAIKVIGVDISAEAVEHAKRRYQRSNLEYLQGSCSAIPLPDASVDMVVSYETIEHHNQHEEMMQEIQRVLRPNGLLLISSPDKYYYSDEPNYSNPHHVKELYELEFKQLLKKYFNNTTYFGQRITYGSAILPESLPATATSYRHEQDEIKSQSGLIKPVYWIALASDGELPTLSSSIFDQPINDSEIVQSWRATLAERDTQIARLNNEVAKYGRQNEDLNDTIAKYSLRIEDLNDEIVRRGEWAQNLQSELIAVTHSKSWRITTPLREVRRWMVSPKEQIGRYTKKALTLGKHTYQTLPISPTTKMAQRRFLAKHMPWLLRASNAQMGYAAAPPLPIAETPPELTRDELDILARTITLRTSSEPLVSVVIPVYGKCNYTLHCLDSIAKNPPSIAYEVIVIDDCSPDNSSEVLRYVEGIKLICNIENQGFIRSCNNGAKMANGEYVYFLNNDTQVAPHWLDELHRTFIEFPGTGLAGSKLIYPDGTLQEAGGIIWKDGSAWNFGRNQDPLLPIYNYAREVDYCSGASIMVPKTLFDELGGFDERYLPAYCEDSDLALKIRDKGHRVIYQPLSTIIHFEGVTSGTDTTQGTKAYQVENSKKLFARWQQRLATHQVPGTEVDAAKDRRATRRVLVLDHCTPTPNQDAGSVTVFNTLLLLREMDFQVTFIPEDNFLYLPEYTTALQRAGVEVLYAPYVTSVEKHLKECGGRYDLAFLFRPGVIERHLKAIRKYCPNAKVLYHTVDLHFLRMSREAELQSDKVKQKAADEMQQRELAAIGCADASIVHSTVEVEILHPLVPEAKLHVFPLIMDVQGAHKAYQERRDIVFVGGYQHTPNVDAVKYFSKEVMPLLRKKLPGVRFYAVGSKPTTEIQALASEDIIITGFVEDLTPLLDKVRVSVAPLRYGAGIKGKIGTAMAVGLPVVATSLAVEGMSLTDGKNILVADGDENFANAVSKIYQDEALWNCISQNSLMFVDKAWGAESAWQILAEILRELDFNLTRGNKQLNLYSADHTAVISASKMSRNKS